MNNREFVDGSKPIKSHLVMKAVVLQCDRLNLIRYQLHITIPPRESTLMLKTIKTVKIDVFLVDLNNNIYKYRVNSSHKLGDTHMCTQVC